MIKKFEDFNFDKIPNKVQKEIIYKEREEEKEPNLKERFPKKAKKDPIQLPNWGSY